MRSMRKVAAILCAALIVAGGTALTAGVAKAASPIDVILYKDVASCSGWMWEVTRADSYLGNGYFSDQASGWKGLVGSGKMWQDHDYSGWAFGWSAGKKDCDLTDNIMGTQWWGVTYTWNDQITSVSAN